MKHNLFKKTVATMLSLVLVLATLIVLPLGVGAASLPNDAAWDGTTKTQPTGNGTEASPYLIATAANLAWLSDSAATLATQSGTLYLQMAANIDLANKSFTPINLQKITGGDAANGYTYGYRGVVILGQGATIKGLDVAGSELGGLFAGLGNGSNVDDLHFVGAEIATTVTGSAGILAAELEGTVTINKVSTDATS